MAKHVTEFEFEHCAVFYLWHLHLNSGEILVLEVRGTRARARSHVFSMALQAYRP